MIHDMIDAWENGEYYFALFFAAVNLLILAAALGATLFLGNWVLGLGQDVYTIEPGIVIGKVYSPDTQETHPVTTVNGNGGVGVGVVTTGDAEHWITIIRIDDEVWKFDDLTVWSLAKVNGKITCIIKRNPRWDPKLVKVKDWEEK